MIEGSGSVPRTNESVADFIDPDCGDKVNSGIALSHRPAGYSGWRTTTVRQLYAEDFIPQSRIYEFGYSKAQNHTDTDPQHNTSSDLQ